MGAELRLAPVEGGRWTWRYVEPETGIELESNETYATREAAAEWAHQAYPDLALVEEEHDGR